MAAIVIAAAAGGVAVADGTATDRQPLVDLSPLTDAIGLTTPAGPSAIPAPSPTPAAVPSPAAKPKPKPATKPKSAARSPRTPPKVVKTGRCKASYYATGRSTASGERFNPNAWTAAHKSLPFGTQVRVTNPGSGKAVVVRINDRGPYVSGRCLDLARAAFGRIASLSAGVVTVEYEVLGR